MGLVQRGRFRLYRVLLSAGVLAGIATAAAAPSPHSRDAAAATVLPAALHGVWFEATAEGGHACEAHRRTRLSSGDEAWMSLIGAIVVSPRLAHFVAEYGEGTFYEVVRIEPLAPGAWRLHSRIGIDTLHDPGAAEGISELRLASGRLHWRDADDPHAASRPPYARCMAALPPGAGRQPQPPSQSRTVEASNGQSSSASRASSRSTGTRRP